MKRWLKEPLLHFLLAGGLLFVVYARLHRGGGEEPRVVRITAAEVNWLKETWSRQWHRPPDEQELRGLVTDYLKEELLAREARELRLDENDTIVRRRLAQKMEFIVQDTLRLAEPGEEALRRLYDDHRARYQNPTQISFTQLYFKTEAAARRGLEELRGDLAAEPGDRSLLEREYARVDAQTVTSLFGRKFADTLFGLDPGRWRGPIASGYGFHLVRINERQVAQPLPFDEVRARLRDDWRRLQEVEANEQFFAGLVKRYDVIAEESIQPLIVSLLAERVR